MGGVLTALRWLPAGVGPAKAPAPLRARPPDAASGRGRPGRLRRCHVSDAAAGAASGLHLGDAEPRPELRRQQKLAAALVLEGEGPARGPGVAGSGVPGPGAMEPACSGLWGPSSAGWGRRAAPRAESCPSGRRGRSPACARSAVFPAVSGCGASAPHVWAGARSRRRWEPARAGCGHLCAARAAARRSLARGHLPRCRNRAWGVPGCPF